jgi:pseudouridine synthase
VELDDGRTAPAKVRRVSPRVLEITIREGRNRQVRRMLQRVGNEVESLERVRFASLPLGTLPRGEARQLTRSEVSRLWKDAGSMDEPDDRLRR